MTPIIIWEVLNRRFLMSAVWYSECSWSQQSGERLPSKPKNWTICDRLWADIGFEQ